MRQQCTIVRGGAGKCGVAVKAPSRPVDAAAAGSLGAQGRATTGSSHFAFLRFPKVRVCQPGRDGEKLDGLPYDYIRHNGT